MAEEGCDTVVVQRDEPIRSNCNTYVLIPAAVYMFFPEHNFVVVVQCVASHKVEENPV